MEMNELLNKYGIIGIVSDYKLNVKEIGLVKDLNVKDITKALKIVGLNDDYLGKDIGSLTISELFKIDLMLKLDKDIIIIGDLSTKLIHKDLEYIKKLLIKLNNDYNKKIIVIDKNVKVFFNLVKRIVVTKDKTIIYDTSDFYDDKLYEYVNIPKIIDFIKYINNDGKRLNNTLDIYELIKDIYRSVS